MVSATNDPFAKHEIRELQGHKSKVRFKDCSNCGHGSVSLKNPGV